MWYTLLFTVLCGALAVQVQGQSLADMINAQVANTISATNAQISATNAHIQSQLFPNYQPVQSQVSLNNGFGTSGFNSLNNLGAMITQNVNQQLEPVRAITPNLNIRNGVGGTTIISYQSGGKQFIKRSGKMWACSGPIDVNTGACSGDLSLFSLTNSSPKTDWCYVSSYSIVNNHICLSTGGISVTSINGQASCTSNYNPYIMFTLDDYKSMCSGLSSTIKYIYIPDLNDPNHVDIPNSNKHVKCDNNQQNYCVITEDNPAMNTYANGGSVMVQNGGSVIQNGQSYISNGQSVIQSSQSIVSS